MPLFPAASAGVYLQESVLAPNIASPQASVGAVVFGSQKGDLTPQLITDIPAWLSEYGNPNSGWSLAPYCSLEFLINSQNLYGLRVANLAQYAGLMVENDTFGINGGQTRIFPLANGTPTGQQALGEQQLTHLVFSGPLITGNSFSLTVANGTNQVNLTPVPFDTTNNQTLVDIATALQTLINTNFILASPNIGATVSPIVLSNPPGNNFVIRVVAPTNVDLIFTNLSVTGGSSQATVTTQNPKLFDVFAENPGAWGNNIGIQLANVNVGLPDEFTLTFSGPLVTGNTVNLQISVKGNLIQVPLTSFSTSSAQTLQNLANNIVSALNGAISGGGISSASVLGNVISFNAPVTGADTTNVITAVVTGGASQPTIATVQTLTGIAAPNTFNILVFNRANINIAVEQFVVSFNQQTDGFGDAQFIETVINSGVNPSANIRVVYNALNPAGFLTNPDVVDIFFLGGGNDGVLPTNSQIVTGWNAFTDPDTFQVQLMINGGYTDPSVQTIMLSIAANRQDCVAILDMPSTSQNTAQNCIAYRNNVLNANSTYGAIYTPDVQILDQYNNQVIFIPPSGHVCSRLAWVDVNLKTWFAAAGWIQGPLNDITGLRVVYVKGDRDAMDPQQINTIRRKPGKGYAIWGNNTLNAVPSPLSDLSVRRLLLYMEGGIRNFLDNEVFVQDTGRRRTLINQQITSYLQPIQDGEGLNSYFVDTSDSINGPIYEDAGQMNINVYFAPVRPAKTIVLQMIVTPSGVQFQELVANGQQ